MTITDNDGVLHIDFHVGSRVHELSASCWCRPERRVVCRTQRTSYRHAHLWQHVAAAVEVTG